MAINTVKRSKERALLLNSLMELKNQFIQQSRYTDCVDEIIFKVANIMAQLLVENSKWLKIQQLCGSGHNWRSQHE